MYYIVFVSLVTANLVSAEDQLNEVVETTTKKQLAIEEPPASVDVITSETIKKADERFPDKTLRTLPGVHVERRDGVVGLSDSFAPILLRGMPNASQTLVLMDGQLMNNYEGNIH